MTFPKLHPAGIDGLLIRFADTLSEAANRAALAFRARLAQEAWPEIEETSASLVSVLIRFDPMQSGPDNLKERVQACACPSLGSGATEYRDEGQRRAGAGATGPDRHRRAQRPPNATDGNGVSLKCTTLSG